MKARMIVPLLAAAALLSLCSFGLSDDAPDFSLLEAPDQLAAAIEDDIPEFNLLEALPVAAEDEGDKPDFGCLEACDCDCEAGGTCDCEDCLCNRKATRSVQLPTMKLSAEATARMNRPPNGTQWVMITAPWIDDDGSAQIKSVMEPKGWTFSDDPWAMLRKLEVTDRPAAAFEVNQLPTWILIRDGKEIERVEKYPGTKYLGERYNAAATGKELSTQSAASPPARRGYPIKPGFENLRAYTNPPGHAQQGVHAGHFPAEWVATLSIPEWESLHDDHHAGRVKWEYVPGHQQQASAASVRREPIYEDRKFCGRFGCYMQKVIVGYRDLN